MVRYDGVGSDIADGTVNHQSRAAPLCDDHTQFANSSATVLAFELGDSPRDMSDEPCLIFFLGVRPI